MADPQMFPAATAPSVPPAAPQTPAAPAAPAAPVTPVAQNAASASAAHSPTVGYPASADDVDYNLVAQHDRTAQIEADRKAKEDAFYALSPDVQRAQYAHDPANTPVPSYLHDPEVSGYEFHAPESPYARQQRHTMQYMQAMDQYRKDHPAPTQQAAPAQAAPANPTRPTANQAAGIHTTTIDPVVPGAAGANRYQFHQSREEADPRYLAMMDDASNGHYSAAITRGEEERRKQNYDDAMQSPFFQQRMAAYTRADIPYEAAVGMARQDTASYYGIQSDYQRQGNPATDTNNVGQQVDRQMANFARSGNVNSLSGLRGTDTGGYVATDGKGGYTLRHGNGDVAYAANPDAVWGVPHSTLGGQVQRQEEMNRLALQRLAAQERAINGKNLVGTLRAGGSSKDADFKDLAKIQAIQSMGGMSPYGYQVPDQASSPFYDIGTGGQK